MVLVCILRQKNLVHTSPPYFLKIYFDTVLPFTPNVFKWFHPLQLCICISCRSHAFCMLFPYYSPWIYHYKNIWFRAQVMQFLLWSFLQLAFNLFFRYSLQHAVLKHILSSSFNVREIHSNKRQNYVFVYIYSLLFM
jgi:hypothetical protein